MTFSIMTLDMKDSCLVYKHIEHKTFYIVCHYAECSYCEDHALFTVVLNVVKVIVIMLNVVKVNVIMLNVVLLSVVVPPKLNLPNVILLISRLAKPNLF